MQAVISGTARKSPKFREFYCKRIRCFKEFLKTKSLKETQTDGMSFFIKANLAFDNAEVGKLLLKNGLCELTDECEFLRKKAKFTA